MINRRNLIFLIGLVLIAFSPNNLADLNSHPDKNELFILEVNSEKSWSRIIINDGILTCPNLHVLNNSIILTGLHIGYDTEIYAAKYYENGTVQWEFRHTVDRSTYFEQSVDDLENNIIILALVPELDSDEHETLFVKIDQDGKLLSSKYIPELTDCEIKSIALDSHNYIYVSGISLGILPNPYFLMKLDSNGNFVYSIAFDEMGSPYVYCDKFDNIFVDFYNDFGSLYKFNTNGSIIWKVGSYRYLHSDNAENVFAKNYSYLVKLNSSGDILKKTKIKSGPVKTYSQNYTYIFYEDEKFILKYDNDIILRWNVSLEEYIKPGYAPRYYITNDSNENVYIVYDSNENSARKGIDISILKLNRSGDFVSQIFWGGNHDESDFEVLFDSQNNLYLLTTCLYVNIWNKHTFVSILVKNPLDGGNPAFRDDEIDVGLIVLFVSLGVSSSVSIIICFNIIKKPKNKEVLSQ